MTDLKIQIKAIEKYEREVIFAKQPNKNMVDGWTLKGMETKLSLMICNLYDNGYDYFKKEYRGDYYGII